MWVSFYDHLYPPGWSWLCMWVWLPPGPLWKIFGLGIWTGWFFNFPGRISYDKNPIDISFNVTFQRASSHMVFVVITLILKKSIFGPKGIKSQVEEKNRLSTIWKWSYRFKRSSIVIAFYRTHRGLHFIVWQRTAIESGTHRVSRL